MDIELVQIILNIAVVVGLSRNAYFSHLDILYMKFKMFDILIIVCVQFISCLEVLLRPMFQCQTTLMLAVL